MKDVNDFEQASLVLVWVIFTVIAVVWALLDILLIK